MVISRSLVKGFLTKVKIGTQYHQSAHKFKYGTSTAHESKASQLAQKDPPLFFTKRFAVIAQGCRGNSQQQSLIKIFHQVLIKFAGLMVVIRPLSKNRQNLIRIRQ